jgi:hypothetical protein
MRVHLELVSESDVENIHNVGLGEGKNLDHLEMEQAPGVGEEVIGLDDHSYKVLRRVWAPEAVHLLVIKWECDIEP